MERLVHKCEAKIIPLDHLPKAGQPVCEKANKIEIKEYILLVLCVGVNVPSQASISPHLAGNVPKVGTGLAFSSNLELRFADLTERQPPPKTSDSVIQCSHVGDKPLLPSHHESRQPQERSTE